MVPWKGRLSFRQYIPSKPDRFGIKLYTLCESRNSYICDFDVYTGSDYNPDPTAEVSEERLGHSYHVVLGLLRRCAFLNKGYSLYVDNYYTSPTLFDELCAEDTSCVGTVRTNRKEVPKALKLKLKRGDTVFRQRNNLLAMKWVDKRDVCMLTTKHGPTMTVTNKQDRDGNQIIKPTCVLDYNAHMGGVDTSDQMVKYYNFTRKTLKWWVKLFFHLINLAVTNAYLLYRKHNTNPRPLTHYKFRTQLANELTACHVPAKRPKKGRRSDKDNESRLNERHFPALIPVAEGAKRKHASRRCVACNKNTGKRRVPGVPDRRKETSYWCPDCQKPLCVDSCFRRYHTLVHYMNDSSSSDSD